MEKVIFKTQDDIAIVGDYYKRAKSRREGNGGVLLLHMMPEVRGSWRSLARLLVDNNFNVLAIDLRGHGESSFGPGGYKNFKDKDHQKSILDVEAGVSFLKSLDMEKIIIGGASIGANLALWYGAEHPEIKKIFCLSPGLNYRGIKPLDFIFKFNSFQKILLVSSFDDVGKNNQGNTDEAIEIFNSLPLGLNKKIILYKKAGHGTNMFYKNQNNEPDLIKEIIEWIKK